MKGMDVVEILGGVALLGGWMCHAVGFTSIGIVGMFSGVALISIACLSN